MDYVKNARTVNTHLIMVPLVATFVVVVIKHLRTQLDVSSVHQVITQKMEVIVNHVH